MPSLLGSRSRINRCCDPDRGQPRAARPLPVSALIAAGVAAGIAALLCAAAGTARALPLVVTTGSLPDGTVGVAYADSIVAADGVRPWTWTIAEGALPAGLSLDANTGAVSGTPGVTGTSGFVVLATDAVSDTASRPFSITIVGVPQPVSDLSATRLASGNDADGTARIQIAYTATAFAASAQVYRAPFGGYPRYDDAGGSVPPTPSYPPGPPWVLTAVSASGQTDEPSTRDAWSYVVFLKNSAGVPSTVSNKTAPTTNYALGDVSNGVTPGTGDNHVNDADLSLLGAHYGISGSAITSAGVNYLDVGPTLDFSLASRPFTDNRIDFEDLVVFAENYGAVSSPAAILSGAIAAAAVARGPERLAIDAPSHVERDATFAAVVQVEGAGRMQGLSAQLSWDAAVAEPVSVKSSGWLEAQNGVLLSPGPATVDAALLGVRPVGISARGDLATVTFHSIRSGDPAIRFARVLARDAANRAIAADALELAWPGALPERTLLFAPRPNPSGADASLSFALAHAGQLELGVFSLDGRRVRTIARGAFPAGTFHFTWAGDDDSRRAVPPGVYYARLAIRGGPSQTRTIVRLP